MIRALLLALAALVAVPLADAAAPRLVLESRVVWQEAAPGFGGFSGIEVLDGGARFVTISDRGAWATGEMRREGGKLVGLELTGIERLRGISGEPIEGGETDAEGIAVDGRGRVYVSFEAFHRIRRYDPIGGAAERVPPHPDFEGLQPNSALEALAIDADGTLYAIPERSGAWERPFPVYRFRDSAWDKKLRIPREGLFLVAGADFGPDGRLYVLERDFAWTRGFATRIRRFTLGPDGFDRGETLLETPSGSTDNFEGISVWRDAEGVTRITLITDDNFFPLQSTVLVEHRVLDD